MPTMSSFHLLLLILLSLFISIHSCHGRLLSDDQIQPANKVWILYNTIVYTYVYIHMHELLFLIYISWTCRFGCCYPLKREWRGAATTAQSLKDGKTRTSTKVEDHAVTKAVLVSGAVRIQSHVSVSWRVPPMEKHKGHPGFNVDYAGPKTHPPSHNWTESILRYLLHHDHLLYFSLLDLPFSFFFFFLLIVMIVLNNIFHKALDYM